MDLIDLSTLDAGSVVFDSFIQQVKDRFGFDHVAYAGTNPIAGTIHGHVTYPDEWKAKYEKNGFYRIDPTLILAQRSIAPVDWSRLSTSEGFGTVFDAAREFGISQNGLTIPVRGPFGDIGLLSVSKDMGERDWKLLTKSVIGDLQSLAVHIHDAVMNSEALSKTLRHPQLSKREIEILQWTAAGKTQQDIGDILGISHRTVEVHLRSAREKLFALTTPQAVARAIAHRLIYPF